MDDKLKRARLRRMERARKPGSSAYAKANAHGALVQPAPTTTKRSVGKVLGAPLVPWGPRHSTLRMPRKGVGSRRHTPGRKHVGPR